MARHVDLNDFGVENRTYSLAEWEAIEARTGERFEYHEGLLLPVRAMAGGTFEHAVLGANATGVLYAQLLATDPDVRCRTCSSDLRIKIPGTDRYLYPDAAVVCAPPVYDEAIRMAIRNPVVVVEVVSESSDGYDHGRKFEYYSALETLRHYVLVAQDEHHVEVRSRGEGGGPDWRFEFVYGTDTSVQLPALGIALPMRELYRGVVVEDDGYGKPQDEVVPAG